MRRPLSIASPVLRIAAWVLASLSLTAARAEDAKPASTAAALRSGPSLVAVRTRGPMPDGERLGSGFVRDPGIVVATLRTVRAADEIELLYGTGSVERLSTQVLAIDYEHGLVLLGADTPGHEAAPLALQPELPEPNADLVLAGRRADDGLVERRVRVAGVPVLASLGPVILLQGAVEARDEGAVLLAADGRVVGILRVHHVNGSRFGYCVPSEAIARMSADSLWSTPAFPEDAQKRRAETERLKGLQALLQSDFASALPALRASIEAAPTHLLAPSTWWQVGSCLEALGRGEAALEAYETAREGLGTTGAFDEPYGILKELALWTAVARLAPERADAWRALRDLHRELGDDAEALRALEALAPLASEDPAVQLDLGTTYLRLGRTEDALAPLQRAAALDDDLHEAHLQLGLLHEGRRDASAAARAYEDAVRTDPKSAVAVRGLGWAYATLEAWDKACAAYERAYGLEPDSALTVYNLALCYLELGRDEKLAEAVARLRDLDPKAASELEAVVEEARRPPAQVYDVGPRFPAERIREFWQKRYRLASMAYGDAEWAVILTHAADDWQPQRYRSDRKIPREDWNQLRGLGYALTSLAGRLDKWVSTWTRAPGVRSQSLMVTPSFPERDIRSRLARGLRVTSIAHRPGWWGVVMTFPTRYGDQVLLRSAAIDDATVRAYWDRGYRITAAAYGDRAWVLVLSQSSGLDEQTWVLGDAFPEDEVARLWEEGYEITCVARGDGQWLVVLSL